MGRRRLLAWYTLFGVAVSLAWQLAGDMNGSVRLLVSTPARTLRYAVSERDKLFQDMCTTGIESALGLAIAVLVSLALMILCLYYGKLYDWLFPLLFASQIVPLVTLAPFFILLFGFGISAKVAMAVLLSFFPTFLAFARGVASIDRGTRELVRVYAASKTFQVFRVFLPMSMPYLMTGVRVSAPLAVIGAIVGEFNGAMQGLGRNLFIAARRIEPELTVSSVALSTVIGGVFYLSVLSIERLVAPWYESSRPDSVHRGVSHENR